VYRLKGIGDPDQQEWSKKIEIVSSKAALFSSTITTLLPANKN
jgi:hypothetical protein